MTSLRKANLLPTSDAKHPTSYADHAALLSHLNLIARNLRLLLFSSNWKKKRNLQMRAILSKLNQFQSHARDAKFSPGLFFTEVPG